jgi:nitroreductase
MEEIDSRRSIRKYLDKPVEDEKIHQLIKSASLAPSDENTQPWHFVIVKSDPIRHDLAVVSHNQKWMQSAPVFIVCIADIRRVIKEGEFSLDELSPQVEVKQIIRDTAIAMEHIVLEARHLGLDTCWISWHTQKEIRPVLNIPDDKYVVGILLLGYSREAPDPRPRIALDEIIHNEQW